MAWITLTDAAGRKVLLNLAHVHRVVSDGSGGSEVREETTYLGVQESFEEVERRIEAAVTGFPIR